MAAKTRAAKAAAAATPSADSNNDMIFDGAEIRTVPAGSTHVVFKITDVGANQSAAIGVAVFEQVNPDGEWRVIVKESIDNLPATADASSMVFAVRPGARYAITFQGEMHSLWKDKIPLTLELVVNADGVGNPLEDFGGAKTSDGRFCIVRGRARLATEAA